MIQHVDYLSRKIGQPVTLKYPLKFLEDLDSPEELRAYLDDLATVGYIASKMPKTPNILSSLKAYEDLERLNLYRFSNEWKKELISWHWKNQDPETGYWGVRLRSNGELIEGGDLSNTSKFIKLFIDENGKNKHPEFPLRYKTKLINTTITKLKKPVPANLSKQHVWSIDLSLGIRLITDYLWDDLSDNQKSLIKKDFKTIVRLVFSDFFISEQGAFGLNTNQKSADLDGTDQFLSILKRIGILSLDRQKRLWGRNTANNSYDLEEYEVLNKKDLPILSSIKNHNINSIRIYSLDPRRHGFMHNVLLIYYPVKTEIPDAFHLVARLTEWIDSTPQNMGNWVSRERLNEKLTKLNFPQKAIPVLNFNEDDFMKEIDKYLYKTDELFVVGVDIMQVPHLLVKVKIKEEKHAQ